MCFGDFLDFIDLLSELRLLVEALCSFMHLELSLDGLAEMDLLGVLQLLHEVSLRAPRFLSSVFVLVGARVPGIGPFLAGFSMAAVLFLPLGRGEGWREFLPGVQVLLAEVLQLGAHGSSDFDRLFLLELIGFEELGFVVSSEVGRVLQRRVERVAG